MSAGTARPDRRITELAVRGPPSSITPVSGSPGGAGACRMSASDTRPSSFPSPSTTGIVVNPWRVIVSAAFSSVADGVRANVGVVMISRARMVRAPFGSGFPTIPGAPAPAKGPKSPGRRRRTSEARRASPGVPGPRPLRTDREIDDPGATQDLRPEGHDHEHVAELDRADVAHLRAPPRFGGAGLGPVPGRSAGLRGAAGTRRAAGRRQFRLGNVRTAARAVRAAAG